MSALKIIEAPALSTSYGQNVKQTFDDIQTNFDVLANRELYKGDTGRDLVTVNIPWSDVFEDDPDNPGHYKQNIIMDVYTIENFADSIEDALGLFTTNPDDVTDAINGLVNGGWSVTVCFEETEGVAQVLSSVPFVFVDYRFRQNFGDGNSNNPITVLEDKTDMSCTITCNGTWECIQNFPTLYYGYDEGTGEGELYWVINGQKTQIIARGPKGQDGSTGQVYVGLTDDLNIANITGQHAGETADVTVKWLLTSANQNPDPVNETYFPFVSIARFKALGGKLETAPIIILPTTTVIQPGGYAPYYISSANVETVGGQQVLVSHVSQYNICYAHMTNNTIKQFMEKNVLELPATGQSVGVDETTGYAIKRRGVGTTGYSIFVPNNGNLTISYVTDVTNPSINTSSATNSRFRIAGAVIEGKASSVYVGDFAHAEGNNTEASGNYSHAEGAGSKAESDYSHAEGHYTTATGDIGAHAEGFHTNASGKGAHAEGCADDQDSLIITDGDGAHVEGYAALDGEISATGNGAHAEGYTQGGSIIAYGEGAHAEGMAWDGSIMAHGAGAHAEGYAFLDGDGDVSAYGDGAHAEGCSTSSNGNGAHAEGYITASYGTGAHAEGLGTSSNSLGAHAEGYNTLSKGIGAHAEGCANNQDSSIEANNHGAHAEGYVNAEQGSSVQIVASGLGSHAEGYATDESINALGNGSHAEGSGTTALGDSSHAEGYKTTAGALVVNKNDETFYKGCKIFHNSNDHNTDASAVQSRLDYVLTCCIELPQAATVSNISISGTSCNVVGFETALGVDVDEVSDLIYDKTWTLTEISLISTGSSDGTNYVKIQLTTNNSNLYSDWQTLCNRINTKKKYYICFSSITINGTSYIGGPQYTSFASSERDSHTEGSYTCADGEGAHAEGSGEFNSPIIAYGEGAHAEGMAWDGSIMAHGAGAHAEGYADDEGDVIAYGSGAHAEGNDTIAKGTGAHAEGYNTIADGQGSHACGLYNAPGYMNIYVTSDGKSYGYLTKTGSDINRIIFSVGCGNSSSETGSSHRSNALCITRKGQVFKLWMTTQNSYGATYYDGNLNSSYDRYIADENQPSIST